MISVELEPRDRVAAAWYFITPVTAVLAALVLGAFFLWANGFDPLFVYREMARGAFATRYGLVDSLILSTPLIFTGLAAAVSFRSKLYNIGAEGQLMIGAVCAAGIALLVGEALSPFPTIVLATLAGILGAMAWMAVPAISKALFETNEIITTLLLNYVALFLARYLIFGSSSIWRDPTSTNFPQGQALPASAALPKFGDAGLHFGLLFGLVCAGLVFAVMRWTRIGFNYRIFSDSRAAARYAGIGISAATIGILLISAAIAGMAGVSEVLGRSHRLDPSGLSIGLGYTGIIVAALARYHPLGVVPVALFIGGLMNAGDTLQSLPGGGVPPAVSTVLQGAILIFVLAADSLLRYRVRVRRQSYDYGRSEATLEESTEPMPLGADEQVGR